MSNKYYLSVGAMFKNESHSIKEWIEHYLLHGVEHFYLINDNSNDDFIHIIKKYIDNNIITLFNSEEPYYLGRQRQLYNKYILPNIKETKWLLMVDLDEFVWSSLDVNLSNVLKFHDNFAQIQIREHLFGSNGHISQPKYLVKSFTKRNTYDYKTITKIKYFVNSSYDFDSLNIHHASFSNNEFLNDLTKFIIVNQNYFVINHYCCQSRDFWNNNKCIKGDADNYLERKPIHFDNYDVNKIEDLTLYNQNLSLYEDDNDNI